MTRLCHLILILVMVVSAAEAQSISEEVLFRRAALTQQHSDGLIILPGQWEEKGMQQPAWVQESAFFYFTSLGKAPGLILVIDGPADRTVLFSSGPPLSFGVPIPKLDISNRNDWIEQAGISDVLPFSEFYQYVKSRLEEGISTIYLDAPRRPKPDAAPEPLLQVSGRHALWKQSLRTAFPQATFASAASTIAKLRWKKSPSEIDQLRLNATYSAGALRAGMRAITEGASQRSAEAAVVTGCLLAGAEGPSFWPWVMTGPNAHTLQLVSSMFDDRNLNRAFEDDQLVRVDVGCTSGGYGGDVGRTVPVSGSFTEEQARVWNLMLIGYQAGIAVMKSGASLEYVRSASRSAIAEKAGLDSSLKELAGKMNGSGGINWHIHGIGIDPGEEAQSILEEGSVIAYEPGFTHGPDAFYLEDMILITSGGSEILTLDLPYFSDEMKSFLDDEH